MSAESNQTIEIWELSIAVGFFIVVLGGIFAFFDEDEYKASVLQQEIEETLIIMPKDTTINMNISENIEPITTDNEIKLTYDGGERTIPLNRDISASTKNNYLIIKS